MKETFQDQLIRARRLQILEAAVAVISENGFQKTTIRQIAQQAGIADGTIYNYFKNKEGILMGIVEMFTEAEVRELHFEEGKEMGFEPFVDAYVRHRAAEVEQGLPALKVIFAETLFNETLSEKINNEIYGPSFEIAEKFFGEMMKEGKMVPGDPAITARLFASPLLGLLFLRMLGDQHVTEKWDEYVAAMVELILRAYGHGDQKD